MIHAECIRLCLYHHLPNFKLVTMVLLITLVSSRLPAVYTANAQNDSVAALQSTLVECCLKIKMTNSLPRFPVCFALTLLPAILDAL